MEITFNLFDRLEKELSPKLIGRKIKQVYRDEEENGKRDQGLLEKEIFLMGLSKLHNMKECITGNAQLTQAPPELFKKYLPYIIISLGKSKNPVSFAIIFNLLINKLGDPGSLNTV